MFNSQLSFLIIFAGNGILRGKAGGSTTSAVFPADAGPSTPASERVAMLNDVRTGGGAVAG